MDNNLNLPEKQPNNNLVWAILSTCLCCLPLGIVSIVKAASVDKLWTEGKYNEARKTAEDAKKWALWSAITAAIFVLLYVVIFVIAEICG